MGLFGRLAFLALLIEQSHQARLGGFIAFFLLRQTLTVRLGLFLQCLSMSLFAASCFLLGRFQAPHQLIETIPRSGFPFLKGLVLGAQLSQFRGALLEALIDLGQVCRQGGFALFGILGATFGLGSLLAGIVDTRIGFLTIVRQCLIGRFLRLRPERLGQLLKLGGHALGWRDVTIFLAQAAPFAQVLADGSETARTERLADLVHAGGFALGHQGVDGALYIFVSHTGACHGVLLVTGVSVRHASPINERRIAPSGAKIKLITYYG
ncbi:hypothetical protein VO226_08115 [Halomonas elongata]|nr:hypothetical protein [Halomonas elongata]WVI73198.1 hypothetical protein VO226_08115 [Halomonas elongata]